MRASGGARAETPPLRLDRQDMLKAAYAPFGLSAGSVLVWTGTASVLGCKRMPGLFDQAEESDGDAPACAGRLDDASPMALECEGHQGHAMSFATQGSHARDEAPHAVWRRGASLCSNAARDLVARLQQRPHRSSPAADLQHQHVTVDRVIAWR